MLRFAELLIEIENILDTTIKTSNKFLCIQPIWSTGLEVYFKNKVFFFPVQSPLQLYVIFLETQLVGIVLIK